MILPTHNLSDTDFTDCLDLNRCLSLALRAILGLRPSFALRVQFIVVTGYMLKAISQQFDVQRSMLDV
jgi:hypothetical protein